LARARRTRKAAVSGAGPNGASGKTVESERLAYKSIGATTLFVAVTAAGVAGDLITKHHAFATLMQVRGHSREVIPGLLRFTLSTNRGIVGGIQVPGPLVIAATAAAIGIVIFLFASSLSRSWGLHLALGMVLAGSLGNGYDRLFSRVQFPDEKVPRLGQVRDFIDVYVIHWPVFNLADALLVVGVLLIVLHMLRDGRRRRA